VLPDAAVLDSARALVGWRLVVLDSAARTASLARPGMRLDPGGIAKGYAADEALAAMRAEGVERALVVFGGEIVAGAPPPGAHGWIVELPGGDSLELAEAAIASSGDAEQFVVIGGRRYSHVVDPRTGLGLSGGAGATVMARDGLTADALATAASVVAREVAAGWLRDSAVVGADARLIR
jgi:thiamine biosynthesis lipoprotein